LSPDPDPDANGRRPVTIALAPGLGGQRRGKVASDWVATHQVSHVPFKSARTGLRPAATIVPGVRRLWRRRAAWPVNA
jgi:hypothetical protein